MKLAPQQRIHLERFGQEIAKGLADAELELIKARGRFDAVQDIFPILGLTIPEVERRWKLRK